MSSKTKILVLKLKEIVLTAVFVIMGIILIILLILIFSGKHKSDKNIPVKQTYSPGVYSSSIMLSTNPVDIEVTVDSDQIKSVRLINVSDSVAAMYPLINSSLSDIASQVVNTNSTDNITYSSENRYTSIVLLNAINSALEKAENK